MNSHVCIDASLAVRWVLPTEQDSIADSLLQAWDETGIELIVPPLFDAEITSAIRKHVNLKQLLPRQGEQAYRLYRQLKIMTISPINLSEIAWRLAVKFNQVRTYDMQYLALAELEDCEFWTADKKLVNYLRGKTERIKFIGDVTDQGI
jgi:predicted nucleic acid-binding protein